MVVIKYFVCQGPDFGPYYLPISREYTDRQDAEKALKLYTEIYKLNNKYEQERRTFNNPYVVVGLNRFNSSTENEDSPYTLVYTIPDFEISEENN